LVWKDSFNAKTPRPEKGARRFLNTLRLFVVFAPLREIIITVSGTRVVLYLFHERAKAPNSDMCSVSGDRVDRSARSQLPNQTVYPGR
jgi:hypothetical protein